MKMILENDLDKLVWKMKTQCKIRMEQCRSHGGEYIEGNNVNVVKVETIKKGLAEIPFS